MFNLIPLPYKILGSVAAVFILITLSFGIGYFNGKSGAKKAINDYKLAADKQINDLKEMNAAISNRVTVKYVDRVNTIKEKETKYVDLAENNVPSQFELSNGWVHVHDVSSQNGDADAAKSSDERASGVKDNQALVTIIRNYSKCEQNAEQLKDLQQWIKENQAAVEESNKKKKKFGVF